MTLIEKVARAMLADPEDWEDGMLMEEAKAAIAIVLRELDNEGIFDGYEIRQYARENGINLDE